MRGLRRTSAKPDLDILVQTMQSIMRQIDIELHNLPEKSGSRLRALALEMTNVLNIAKLLGMDHVFPKTQEPCPSESRDQVSVKQVVALLRSLPLMMQQKAFKIVREKKIFDLSEDSGPS